MLRKIIKIGTLISVFTILMAWAMPVMAQVGLPEELAPEGVPYTGELAEGNAASVTSFILQRIADGLIYIAAPLAVLLIVHGGLTYVMSGGAQEQMDAAKKEIKWAIIGLALVMFSFLMVRFVISIVIGTQQA